jgi:hypothetical protein
VRQALRDSAGNIAGARDSRRPAEETLETTTVWLEEDPGICRASRYVAEALLRAEGFTDSAMSNGHRTGDKIVET